MVLGGGGVPVSEKKKINPIIHPKNHSLHLNRPTQQEAQKKQYKQTGSRFTFFLRPLVQMGAIPYLISCYLDRTIKSPRIMKRLIMTNPIYRFAIILLLSPMIGGAQCEIFKSEMGDVQQQMEQVHKLTDSLSTYAEASAFGATYKAAKEDARQAMILTGLALGAAYDAADIAEEAQHQSELCGLDPVMSHAIDAQNFTIHTREQMEEAYELAKKAYRARTLGDSTYLMRKSLTAAQEAEAFSQKAVYAAADSYHSCNHSDVSLGGN